MSGRREIRLPISVTVAIDFNYTARVKPGNPAEDVRYWKSVTASPFARIPLSLNGARPLCVIALPVQIP